MKYKVGDVVRIKSKAWYESHKNAGGDVMLANGSVFWCDMQSILGNTYRIKNTDGRLYQLEGRRSYIDEDVIEGLVTEEVSTISANLIKDIAEVIKTHNLGVSIREEDGKIIIEPLASDSLPVDTPCMCSDNKQNWYLRFYKGGATTYIEGYKSSDGMKEEKTWEYIVPFEDFNPNDIEDSIRRNIVRH